MTPADRKAETLALLKQYSRTPTTAIRNKIAILNEGLAHAQARYWEKQCKEAYCDLLQAGYLGLIRSIERFDFGKHASFSTFAVPYISGEIRHYLRDKTDLIKIPREWQEKLYQIRLYEREQLHRHVSEDELAGAIGVNVDEVNKLKVVRYHCKLMSLDKPLTGDTDNTWYDLLPDEGRSDESLFLRHLLDQIDPATRQVVELHFFNDLNHKEISKIIGKSSMTVKRYLTRALRQMQMLVQA